MKAYFKKRTDELTQMYIYDGELFGDADWDLCDLYSKAFEDGTISSRLYSDAAKYYSKLGTWIKEE